MEGYLPQVVLPRREIPDHPGKLDRLPKKRHQGWQLQQLSIKATFSTVLHSLSQSCTVLHNLVQSHRRRASY